MAAHALFFDLNMDILAKSRKPFSVIPAKAGIQSIKDIMKPLVSGSRIENGSILTGVANFYKSIKY